MQVAPRTFTLTKSITVLQLVHLFSIICAVKAKNTFIVPAA